MSLKIQSFTCRVRGDEYSDRVVFRISVESLLDRLSFVWWCWAMVDSNAFPGTVTPFDSPGQLLLQISLGVVVLGKDDDPQIVPPCAALAQIGAHFLTNPGQ